ncbi:MAG: amino acid adenylation domain-containing protein [Bacteroidota bacterium]
MKHKLYIDQEVFHKFSQSATKMGCLPEALMMFTFYEVIYTWADWSDEQPIVNCFIDERRTTVQRDSPHAEFKETVASFERQITSIYEKGQFSSNSRTDFVFVYGGTQTNQRLPMNTQVICMIKTGSVDLEITWELGNLYPHREAIHEIMTAHRLMIQWIADGMLVQKPPVLIPKTQLRVRNTINSVSRRIPDNLLHQDFFEIAERMPHQTALIMESPESRKVTYKELADNSLILASNLVDRGVKSGDLVAISLPKGVEQITGVLGILASGATYVPISPDLPKERREKILHKAGIRYVITNESIAKTYTNKEAEIILVNAKAERHLNKPVRIPSSFLAYVIFTSGSTGEPKGVEITHASAFNTIYDINARYNISDQDCVLALSALDFDLSVYDMFGLLSVGGTIVLPSENDRKEAPAWLQLIQSHQVTIWNTVPALLEMLLIANEEVDHLNTLRIVLSSGDWVAIDLPSRLKKHAPNANFIALGGATEAAIWSNYFEVKKVEEQWNAVPYGWPLSNQKYRIANPQGKDCPNGVEGELWIGGKGIARGYLSEPQLSANSFVTFQEETWYKTGDLGKYWPDGNIEFLGRRDLQVKVNGYRIELGEIESSLKKFEGIEQAVAAVYNTGSSKHLVAGVIENRPVGSLASYTDDINVIESHELTAHLETQSLLVEHFLVDMLGLEKLIDVQKEISIPSLGVVRAQEPLLNLWLEWLIKREVIAVKNNNISGNKRLMETIKNQQDVVNRIHAEPIKYLSAVQERLSENKEAFSRLLQGYHPPTFLFEDEVLSPEALSSSDPGTCEGIKKIADVVQQAAQSREFLSVGILGASTGVLAKQLLEAIECNSIQFTMMEGSSILLKDAQHRLAGTKHQVAFEKVSEEEVPESCHYAFDIVIAMNLFHRYKKAAIGPFNSMQMLKEKGKLFVLEHEMLAPLALVTAAVVEGAFVDYEQERSVNKSPMLEPQQWKSILVEAGFENVSSEQIQDSITYLFEANSPRERNRLTEDQLLDFLAKQLPEHMIPEKIKIISSIPLSTNGKVDRKSFARSFDLQVQVAESNLPQEGFEETIAQMWEQLLEIDQVGRDQVFFQIGGDSLSATRFLSILKKEFDLEISLREIFDAPLSQVAEVVAAKFNEKESEVELMEEGEI